MARSRRKTPIFGFTTADSDHAWKAKAARVLRHRAKQALNSNPEKFDLSGKQWDAVNPWDAPKDGKHFMKSASARMLRK